MMGFLVRAAIVAVGLWLATKIFSGLHFTSPGVLIAAALLLISGIANLGLAARYEFAPPVGKLYNMIAGVKLILALPIFLFASFLSGRSATAQKFQANRVMWLNVNLALAVLMVLIGGFLRFVGRDLKTEKKGATSAVVERP